MTKNFFATMLLLTVSVSSTLSARNQFVPFKMMDSGNITFTSQTSANLVGTGLASIGGRGVSAGVISITGPARCAGGMEAVINGTFTASTGDQLKYSVTQQLCPTEVAGIFAGLGVYRITGGTGRFASASGGGVFQGMGDFVGLKYHCALDGLFSE